MIPDPNLELRAEEWEPETEYAGTEIWDQELWNPEQKICRFFIFNFYFLIFIL